VTLLTPLALGLGALAAPVVLMYLLKLRRQPLEVSSTFLWRKAIDDVQANAPWQRLRISALLILQLLVLLGLVLTQSRPAYSQTQRFTGDLIVMVDESYAMQARDVAPSRFAVAQAQARELVATVPSGNVVSVIGMGDQPTLAIADSSDHGAAGSAIDGLHAGVSAPNFQEALSLAASLARNGQSTRAVVLTSRQSGISTLPVRVPFPVEIRRIGGKFRDLGITTIGATQAGGKVTALVQVQNFGDAPARSDLNLFVDGQLADVRPVQVSAGRVVTEFWKDLPATSRVLQARLTSADAVRLDKQAWAVVEAQSVRRVLMVTSGDFFLQTALTLDPTLKVTTVSPLAYQASRAQHYDLVVFDGDLPSRLPRAPELLFSPPAGAVGPISFGRFVPTGVVARSPAAPLATSAIFQYLDVSDVVVGRARSVALPAWMQPVFSSNGHTLIAAGQNNTERVVAATFNLSESDWPLRISFPVLIRNLVQYLVPGIDVGVTSASAGQIITLSPEPGVRAVEITSPTGATKHIVAPFPPFTGTTAPGVYTVREAGRKGEVRFAVNFAPARPAPATGPARIVVGGTQGGGSRSVNVPVELGWIVVLACLSLLTAEWWLAFRR
jgi:Ca-activated chloride channel homolog